MRKALRETGDGAAVFGGLAVDPDLQGLDPRGKTTCRGNPEREETPDCPLERRDLAAARRRTSAIVSRQILKCGWKIALIGPKLLFSDPKTARSRRVQSNERRLIGYFSVSFSSMRRFCARASGVVPGLAGWYCPKPAAASLSGGKPSSSVMNRTTDSARAWLSSQLSP